MDSTFVLNDCNDITIFNEREEHNDPRTIMHKKLSSDSFDSFWEQLFNDLGDNDDDSEENNIMENNDDDYQIELKNYFDNNGVNMLDCIESCFPSYGNDSTSDEISKRRKLKVIKRR